MHESIHIKIEYPNAVENKKNMLLLEKSMLGMINRIRNYDALRKREFNIKSKIKKDFTELSNAVSIIESHMPKEEAEFNSESYKKEIKTKEITKQVKKKQTEQKKNQIEKDIDGIRSELARLG